VATVIDYVRICPTCRAENPPDVLRCACGALLAGVDLVRKQDEPLAAAHDTLPSDADLGTARSVERGTGPAPGTLRCPHADCGQSNPPGTARCLYCNRPLARASDTASASTPAAHEALAPQSLLQLPAVLATRFAIERMLPAKGAEAELLVVRERATGLARVAKIYRAGFEPRRDVQDRILRIDPRRRVAVYESGTADGHAYEIMELCAHGSLRDRLGSAPAASDEVTAIVRALAAALASIHAAGLVHRDLKPENVLVRALDPLDLVLTDFGIASVLAGTQRFTSVARTLPYAAPESLSGVIDAKSDYWALGMIALEAATGRHPFAGLSEAVILHQLTTRNVDAGGIADRNVRKLVRGLLLRDPALRWGESEVARWLGGDATLPEPVEHGLAAGFTEPYRLRELVCTTPEQLGVALATHWREGISDLGNSQLLAWFRDVQKDHNVVRLLLEVRQERQLHPDVQLLKLILYLAPGIPPVWRGESIALSAILAHASQALDGSADAAQWLHSIYQQRVLEAYVDAGNARMKEVLERWTLAGNAFDKAWREAVSLLKSKAPPRGPDEAVNWDAAMYGRLDPTPPPMIGLHARLLAIAYDARWAERLRTRLLSELAALVVHCPWLAELGDPRTMTPTALLVLEALLPDARKAADRQIKLNTQRRTEEADDCRRKSDALDDIKATLRATAERRYPTADYCDELADALTRYFELLADVRATGRSDEAWLGLRAAAIRMEPVARRMQRIVERLRERLAVSGGWLNARTALPLVFAILLLPRLGPRVIIAVMIVLPLAIVGWRIVPNFLLAGQIRALAQKV
jgi:tRNA A-37 threonylcarbamoyl transferase component Bud32